MIWIPSDSPGIILHPHIKTLAKIEESAPWGYLRSPGEKARKVCLVYRCRHRIAVHRTDKACARCYTVRWRVNNPVKAAYLRLKSHAKWRKIHFDLTFAQFAEFCGVSGYLDNVGITVGCLHVDREDPLKGYTADNIRVLEAGENSRKGAAEDKIAHWLASRRGEVYDQTQLKFDPDNTPF